MNYNIISSGSRGNAVIIEDIILIDCGVSYSKLSNYTDKFKIVLLTHIHSDHFNFRTIKKLATSRPTLRFACCEWLVSDLIKAGISKKNIDLLSFGKLFDYTLFKVSPVKLYHDVPNCGYRVFINNKKMLYATDTYTLAGIEAKGYDLYLLEANYDEKTIQEKIKEKQINNEYIYEYRVINTHLSEQQAYDWLCNNVNNNSEYVYMHQHEDSETI